MAKYKGKHNGETRGFYRKALLYYEPKTHKRTYDLDNELAGLLLQLGYGAGCTINHQFNLGAYHVAGTTIGVSALISREPNVTKGPKHYIQLRLVSNDDLGDVIRKITDRFPFFKDLDHSEARP